MLSGAPNPDDWHRQRTQEIRIMFGIIENRTTKDQPPERVAAIKAARVQLDEALMHLVKTIERGELSDE